MEFYSTVWMMIKILLAFGLLVCRHTEISEQASDISAYIHQLRYLLRSLYFSLDCHFTFCADPKNQVDQKKLVLSGKKQIC